ncbi:hypothetical protein SAMN04488134_101777 [Amphibacillus marinus]|uniref:Uncharacterized protein n=1 Tax=Amphibacillus marinus TaxID=872970 RepID=A0A1H8J0P7_9BACI|nr:hypothetical protein [Amphibacillus marinus]SEN73727.1 hypothetical protein SAMN04488134_101777 [Amphibacillus marinus]
MTVKSDLKNMLRTEPVFSKLALVISEQFSFGDKAILGAVLENKEYTISEAKAAVVRHKRRRVI